MCRIILEETYLDAPPIPLVEIIEEIVLRHGIADSKAEARELAETWHDATFKRLIKEANELASMGRPVQIDFNSSSVYMIQGACFPEQAESIQVKEAKLRRLSSTKLSEAFEGISADDFEILCGRVLELFGVQNPTVTRRTADEGIDFYGLLHLENVLFPDDLRPTVQRQLKIWLVGQAKHYIKTQSGTSEIRELVGALTLARAGAFGSKNPPYENLNIRVGDPVFALLITTGTLSSHAWRLLDRSGIIAMDGEMLAAFLSDRGVAQEGGSFDAELFYGWLGKGEMQREQLES